MSSPLYWSAFLYQLYLLSPQEATVQKALCLCPKEWNQKNQFFCQENYKQDTGECDRIKEWTIQIHRCINFSKIASLSCLLTQASFGAENEEKKYQIENDMLWEILLACAMLDSNSGTCHISAQGKQEGDTDDLKSRNVVQMVEQIGACKEIEFVCAFSNMKQKATNLFETIRQDQEPTRYFIAIVQIAFIASLPSTPSGPHLSFSQLSMTGESSYSDQKHGSEIDPIWCSGAINSKDIWPILDSISLVPQTNPTLHVSVLYAISAMCRALLIRTNGLCGKGHGVANHEGKEDTEENSDSTEFADHEIGEQVFATLFDPEEDPSIDGALCVVSIMAGMMASSQQLSLEYGTSVSFPFAYIDFCARVCRKCINDLETMNKSSENQLLQLVYCNVLCCAISTLAQFHQSCLRERPNCQDESNIDSNERSTSITCAMTLVRCLRTSCHESLCRSTLLQLDNWEQVSHDSNLGLLLASASCACISTIIGLIAALRECSSLKKIIEQTSVDSLSTTLPNRPSFIQDCVSIVLQTLVVDRSLKQFSAMSDERALAYMISVNCCRDMLLFSSTRTMLAIHGRIQGEVALSTAELISIPQLSEIAKRLLSCFLEECTSWCLSIKQSNTKSAVSKRVKPVSGLTESLAQESLATCLALPCIVSELSSLPKLDACLLEFLQMFLSPATQQETPASGSTQEAIIADTLVYLISFHSSYHVQLTAYCLLSNLLTPVYSMIETDDVEADTQGTYLDSDMDTKMEECEDSEEEIAFIQNHCIPPVLLNQLCQSASRHGIPQSPPVRSVGELRSSPLSPRRHGLLLLWLLFLEHAARLPSSRKARVSRMLATFKSQLTQSVMSTLLSAIPLKASSKVDCAFPEPQKPSEWLVYMVNNPSSFTEKCAFPPLSTIMATYIYFRTVRVLPMATREWVINELKDRSVFYPLSTFTSKVGIKK